MQPKTLTKCLAGLLCGLCTLSVYAKDVIHVATNPTYPPFEFKVNGELTGFEMELITAMVKEMGKDIEFVSMKFDGILPAIMTHMADVGASGFSQNPERLKKVSFTDPFYTAGLSIIVPKGSTIDSLEDLKGKKISVQLGSTSHRLAKKVPDAQITTFEDANEAILNLMTQQADAVINGTAMTSYMLAKNKSFQENLLHYPNMANATPMGMIVNKDNKELLAELNKALATLKANGTYDALHQKYFGNQPKK